MLKENLYNKNDTLPSYALIKFLIIIIGSIIILGLLFSSFYTIPAGYKGIVLTFQKPNPIAVGEGIHFKIPIVQSVIKVDTRTQKYEADLTGASSDLQDVFTKIAINYHLSPDSVVPVYSLIGLDYADKVVYPLEQESNKASISKYVASDLVKNRELVRTDMETLLREKLSPRGIVVESISIIDFKYSDIYAKAIEEKVTAEQNALTAKNKLEQIKYEAEQRVVQAKGEADAIAIQVSAINSQGGKDYVQLQAISKWDGKLPIYMFGSGGATPFIDINKENKP